MGERAGTGRTTCGVDVCVFAFVVKERCSQNDLCPAVIYLPGPFREETSGCGGINRDLSSSIYTNTTSSDRLRVCSVRVLLSTKFLSCMHRWQLWKSKSGPSLTAVFVGFGLSRYIVPFL